MTTNMDFARGHSLGGNSRGENSPGGNLKGWKFSGWEFTRWEWTRKEFTGGGIHLGEFSVHRYLFSEVYFSPHQRNIVCEHFDLHKNSKENQS